MIDYNLVEYQYRDSLKRIQNYGVITHNRTGIDTMAVQHQYFNIHHADKFFPILKGKKVYPKMALKELIWMLMGRTDVQWLHDHKVTYWDEWVLDDGTIGKSYGYQYRNFNGIDQLSVLVNDMINNPTSRRHIISLWNVSDLDKMSLPPCMYEYHFSCIPRNGGGFVVDMHTRARSNDSFLGVPYDFMFCGWFINLIVIYLNLKVGEIKYYVGDIHYTADDYHMYINHKDAVMQYLHNVEENFGNVISKAYNECYINMDIFNDNNINNIDDFLNIIEKNISTKNISIINHHIPECSDINFEYGPIKAEIAI